MQAVYNGDFSVLEYEEDFHVIGCGDAYTMECLAASRDKLKPDPEKAILKALQVTGKFSAVQSPCDVKRI